MKQKQNTDIRQATEPTSKEQTGKILLIVDDDQVFRQRLALAMEKRGYITHTAENSKEALTLAAQVMPDYAIVDLRLVNENGLEIVPALRHLKEKMRIIMLTGYGNIATAVASVKAGAVDYLAKPADADAIEAALLQKKSELPEISPVLMSADRVRWEYIQRVFEQCGRNVSETARSLRMHRRTLQRILGKYAPKD
ncbi:MAG TPA: ActR/PrrA/RegA family redox response regulator transcription factor [Alphaproteobacteria bacterium]|jgi:two-component system response regulator RegA|nr:ActR/PrrA/RegA family redox response regulator transcription factor [Alphaproteobacteria bacterium]